MNDITENIGIAVAAVFAVLALVLICGMIYGFFIMLLWNWLIPIVVPGGQLIGTITFWQGWGLSVLVHCIFPKSANTTKEK